MLANNWSKSLSALDVPVTDFCGLLGFGFDPRGWLRRWRHGRRELLGLIRVTVAMQRRRRRRVARTANRFCTTHRASS